MAFHMTNLKTIQLPRSLEFIGQECFSECQSLGEVIFEAGKPIKIGEIEFKRNSDSVKRLQTELGVNKVTIIP
jgi:hypothetical protein